MISLNQPISQVFPLINQLLHDAFKIDSYFFTDPYQDIDKVDRGFRKIVWDQYQIPQINLFSDNKQCYRLLIIKSSLNFYNIIAMVSLDEQPDLITIGPFLDEELSPAFFMRTLKEGKLSSDNILLFKEFYHLLPIATLDDIITMTNHLITTFIPEFKNVTPEYINYSEETHEFVLNPLVVREYSFRSAEQYAQYLNSFLDALPTGDYEQISNHMKLYLGFTGITKEPSLSKLKKNLSIFNAHCKCKLLSSPIPPQYVLQLFNLYDAKIDTSTSHQKLVSLAPELVHKYYLLVKNYAHPDYSLLTCNVINYITQHLAEELSLSVIAEHLDKNASFLSGQFSKETGQSITEYIHQQRIQAALRYFNTTKMSIAEVAASVGIHDFGYFSKLFKNHIGTSPSEYKKKLHRRS